MSIKPISAARPTQTPVALVAKAVFTPTPIFCSEEWAKASSGAYVCFHGEWHMDDITESEFLAQIEKGDKSSIEMEGFEHWVKNQKKLYKYFEKNKPNEYKVKLEYFQRLRLWAKENNYLKEGQFARANKQKVSP